MWQASLPLSCLKHAIRHRLLAGPLSFETVTLAQPQMRGGNDLNLDTGALLWRGLSEDGLAAISALHLEHHLFFWLCAPDNYSAAARSELPPLNLESSSDGWLPTLMHHRPPTAAEAMQALNAFVEAVRTPGDGTIQ